MRTIVNKAHNISSGNKIGERKYGNKKLLHQRIQTNGNIVNKITVNLIYEFNAKACFTFAFVCELNKIIIKKKIRQESSIQHSVNLFILRSI